MSSEKVVKVGGMVNFENDETGVEEISWQAAVTDSEISDFTSIIGENLKILEKSTSQVSFRHLKRSN